MKNLIEIRWHGRGGQGAKTASLLLADAAFNTGKYIQGFPEYGPERMGAPITAYNRITEPRFTHCLRPSLVLLLIGVVLSTACTLLLLLPDLHCCNTSIATAKQTKRKFTRKPSMGYHPDAQITPWACLKTSHMTS